MLQTFYNLKVAVGPSAGHLTLHTHLKTKYKKHFTNIGSLFEHIKNRRGRGQQSPHHFFCISKTLAHAGRAMMSWHHADTRVRETKRSFTCAVMR